MVPGSVTVGDAPLQPGGRIPTHVLGAVCMVFALPALSCSMARACTAPYCAWPPDVFLVLQMGSTVWPLSSTLRRDGTVRLSG